MQKISFINDSNIFIDNAISIHNENMGQKLFCTFVTQNELDKTLDEISRRYTILYNKIFILESPQSEELICTYNIDTNNITSSPMVNTILLHRKIESNTLYTINALNTLIKSLNGGVLDTRFIIKWPEYKNSILLTNGPDLRKLDTVIYKIVEFNQN